MAGVEESLCALRTRPSSAEPGRSSLAAMDWPVPHDCPDQLENRLPMDTGSFSDSRVGLATSREDGLLAYDDGDGIAGLVRDAVRSAGFGKANPSAPLADIIRPGMTVLVKPNWVLHENKSGLGMDCLVTHPRFILAVLQEVFKASPGKVVIGDAPVQGCDFDALVTPAWRRQVREMASCPVEILDFRRTIMHKDGLMAGQHRDVRGEERYVLFDLGKDSLLEPVSSPEGRFRITNYDPDRLTERHRPGRHQYLLCREPFEADVILSLPKLKTHKKAGLTGALKNLVGLNGNKEFLPHHRLGGKRSGGDCYPGFAPLKRLAELCYDAGNRRIGTRSCKAWYTVAHKLAGIHRRFGDPEMEGGWSGNDTVWRMTLDLNRLLLFGRPDGNLSDVPLRRIYSLTDALVAGEGDGPLAPAPRVLGAVTFALSSPAADRVHAALMGLDPDRIPLVRESFGAFRYPLVSQPPQPCTVGCGPDTMDPQAAGQAFGKTFRAPAGWARHLGGAPRSVA